MRRLIATAAIVLALAGFACSSEDSDSESKSDQKTVELKDIIKNVLTQQNISQR